MRQFKYWAVKLSGIIILVFLAQIFVYGFTELFVLNSNSFFQPWRFFTAIFLHAGLLHLILNIFALLLFGSVLEKLAGEWRMLLVFLSSGVVANLVSVNFYNNSLGASGAIFGVIGVLMILRPLMPVFAFSLPMPMFIAGMVWAVADILGTYGFLTGNPIDNAGNIAHLSGMLLGLLMGILLRKNFKEIQERKEKIELDEDYVKNWEDDFVRG